MKVLAMLKGIATAVENEPCFNDQELQAVRQCIAKVQQNTALRAEFEAQQQKKRAQLAELRQLAEKRHKVLDETSSELRKLYPDGKFPPEIQAMLQVLVQNQLRIVTTRDQLEEDLSDAGDFAFSASTETTSPGSQQTHQTPRTPKTPQTPQPTPRDLPFSGKAPASMVPHVAVVAVQAGQGVAGHAEQDEFGISDMNVQSMLDMSILDAVRETTEATDATFHEAQEAQEAQEDVHTTGLGDARTEAGVQNVQNDDDADQAPGLQSVLEFDEFDVN
jgi:hypothetical protein